MDKSALKQQIRSSIPLADAMGIEVVSSSENKVVLTAPFALNKNHHGTIFGGSIVTLMTLTGWAQVREALGDKFAKADVVVARSEISYRAPIYGDIQSETTGLQTEKLRRFLHSLEKKGKAVLQITVHAGAAGVEEGSNNTGTEPAAVFSGTYVAALR